MGLLAPPVYRGTAPKLICVNQREKTRETKLEKATSKVCCGLVIAHRRGLIDLDDGSLTLVGTNERIATYRARFTEGLEIFNPKDTNERPKQFRLHGGKRSH